MADLEKQNRLTETSYNSEAWHYRHAVVSGIIFFFSIFYLLFLGIKAAICGFFSGIATGWTETVKPFMNTASQKLPIENHETTNS